MLKIGNLRLNSRLILAPMAGISDLPFRLLNRRFGARLAFVEMINVRSLGYKSRKTEEMLSTSKEDKPLGIQILGCEPDYILRALDILGKYKYDILDFNAACPVKKVTRRGEGASLLKDPLKLQGLLRLAVRNSRVPVTLKMRTGWDRNSINAREVALYAQEAGVSALFIHGRTKTQGYSGQVDYAAIRQVKKASDIPVIASGNVFSPELAEKMLKETGCDAVLVARGALGNPWFFSARKELPQADEIARVMLEHLDACIDFYGERNAVSIFHKFFGWYSRGFRKIRRLREKAYRAKTREEMRRLIEDFRSCKRAGRRAG